MKQKFSVYASLLAATPADGEKLAAWLAERAAEQVAARETASISVQTIQDNRRLASFCGPYDEQIANGQIRILSKRYTEEPHTIPYVAVLDQWEEGIWLVLPFSPYQTPATPGEMATGIGLRGLNVLQAWNGRTVQDALLKKSFLFGNLPEKVREDALALFRHELGGVELPDTFHAERGGQIFLEDDPRLEYLDEAVSRLVPLSTAVLEFEEAVAGEEETVRGGTLTDPLEVSQSAQQKLLSRIGERLPELWQKYQISRIAYAAASDEVKPRIPLLLIEGNWDISAECFEVSGFSGFYPGDDPYTLVFDICENAGLPAGWETSEGVFVVAYKRLTKEQVGVGELLFREDGRKQITIRLESDVAVDDVKDLVLVIAKGEH